MLRIALIFAVCAALIYGFGAIPNNRNPVFTFIVNLGTPYFLVGFFIICMIPKFLHRIGLTLPYIDYETVMSES